MVIRWLRTAAIYPLFSDHQKGLDLIFIYLPDGTGNLRLWSKFLLKIAFCEFAPFLCGLR